MPRPKKTEEAKVQTVGIGYDQKKVDELMAAGVDAEDAMEQARIAKQ